MSEAQGTQIPEPPAPYVREETFLARYPRNLKIGVTLALLLLAVSPVFVNAYLARMADQKVETVKPPEVYSKLTLGQARRLGRGGTAAVDNSKPDDENKIDTGLPNLPVSAASEAAATENDTDDHNARMARAPDPGLSEDSAEGTLPRIGEDGRKPWQVYARPFNPADRRPRIAIIITDLGLSRIATDAAINRMHSNVTMAFDVQSTVTGAWLNRARQVGHETLLDLPMEPFDYPRSDPGPKSLLTNLPASDNLQRLYWGLRQSTGYVGVTSLSGSRFTTDPTKMQPVVDALRARGLLIFDSNIAPHSVFGELAKQAGVPTAAGTMRIDTTPTADGIDDALRQLEQTARLDGRAVGIASPLPLSLTRLEEWIKQLPSHGIALAPLSAVVE